MTGSLVRSLYRLYVRQIRSIARENLTVRAVRPLGAWLWEEFGEEPKPSEAGSRYRASACQDAAPWLREESILGDGLAPQQVLQIVRKQFRSPSTVDPSEQLDQAVQGLRALSDWTHLSRTSSLARAHGVEVELTGACLGLARDIAGGALRMALNFAGQAAAAGYESDSQFEEEEFDEGMGDAEEAGWEGEEKVVSVSEAGEPGDGEERAEVSITGGALGHPEVLRMLHELMQASEAPRLGENLLESSSSSRAAHVPFSPSLKGKTEAMGASLQQQGEDLEADKEEATPDVNVADDGDDVLCYLARLRISNTGPAPVRICSWDVDVASPDAPRSSSSDDWKDAASEPRNPLILLPGQAVQVVDAHGGVDRVAAIFGSVHFERIEEVDAGEQERRMSCNLPAVILRAPERPSAI